MALASLSAKIKKDTGKTEWDEDIKSEFNRQISQLNTQTITLMGLRYIPLSQLDRNWLKQHVTAFLSLDDKPWQCSMVGYLFHISQPGQELYRFMTPHYERALEHSFESRGVEDHFIQHLAIEYLEEFLTPDKSLFKAMIRQWWPDRIKKLIDFFYFKRKPWQTMLEQGSAGPESKSLNNFRSKALEAWQKILNKYQSLDGLSNDDKDIISRSALLAVYLPELAEEAERLLVFSCHHVGSDFNSWTLVETLVLLSKRSKQPAAIAARIDASVLQEMLEADLFATYPKEKVIELVEFICSNGSHETREMGLEICNRYAENGHDFLRRVYDRFHS